ncbi:MAG: hypothetical protein IT317_07185 [Anaerolineales bacterium]|nr:hypothetical protein [Anaerolineales bacterium]
MRKALAWLSPIVVVALALAAYLGAVLLRSQGDPLTFARLGDGFVNGAPVGAQGYDGQFAYWIASDPRPAAAASHLDVPAYRYQRLLHPLLAWALAAGQAPLVPWTLVLVNVAAQLAGVWLVERWLTTHGVSRWYALSYGLWAGLVLAVRLDLAEPLAYALAAAALLAGQRGRLGWSAAWLGLALFAKETTLAVWLGLAAWALVNRRWRALGLYAAAALPFAAFQVLLTRWFGAVGLASGGYLATPFEWLPYLGLWRVAGASLPAFALLAAILGPLIVLPSAWGALVAALRLARRDWSPMVWVLGANAALVVFAPFSTFHEPVGIIRLATGLVLAVVLFGAQVGARRVLNYSLFWLAALALVIRD